MNIKNKHVQKIYDRLDKGWHNTKLDYATRREFKQRMFLIELLVSIYENQNIPDEEEIDDLFFNYNHATPEQIDKMIKKWRG